MSHGSSHSDAQAVAVSGGILSGAGADADANVTPVIEASTGNGDIAVSGNINIKSSSEGNAEADAVGVSVGGASVGASLADAVMSPDIDAHIGGGTISAGQNISLGTFHNVGPDGTKIANTTDAHATAAAGALIGGTGGDATTNAAALLDTHVDSPASLTAGGNITLTSMANNDAVAGSEGVTGALAAVGASLADATAGGEIKARMEGEVVDADNLEVNSTALSNADVLAVAVAGGIVSGAGADADANVTPTIEASTGSNDITVTGDVNIQSFSQGNAEADAVGVGAGGVSVGASLADAMMTPSIDTAIGGGNVSAGQNIIIGSYHNMNADGAEIDNNADAHATAPGGSLIGGTGGDATADASAVLDTHVDSGASLSAGNTISAVALANNDADAKSEGISGALVASVGVSLSDATAGGETTTRMMGAVTGANTLAVTANAVNDATATALGVAGGIIGAGTGADADATVAPDIEAVIGTAAITATQVDVTALAEKTATADADGYVGGILGAGAALADAVTSGNTQAHIDSFLMTADTINIDAHTDEVLNAHTQTGAGGILAGSGSIATVTANSTTEAYTGTHADLTANDTLNITAVATPRTSAEAEGVNGGALAVGISNATATVDSTVTAEVGANTVLNAANLEVASRLDIPEGEESAYAHATGSSGGLVGVVATESAAVNNSAVAAVVKGNSTLIISGTTTIDAQLDSFQSSLADGYAGGLIVPGGNSALTESDTTVTAVMEEGVALSGDTLNITASGGDNNIAEAVSGSGGVVSVPASDATTTSKNLTEASVGAGSSSRSLDVANFNLNADHLAEFNGLADSSSGGVIDAPGADIFNQVDTTVNAVIGANAVVNAEQLNAAASNNVLKDWLSGGSYNLISASGGIGSFPAGSSTTEISNRAGVYVEDGAQVTVESDAEEAGTAGFTAFTDVVARDKAKIDTGGAVATSKTESFIHNDTNAAEVVVGAATLVTSGNLNMASWSEVDIETQSSAKTYGLAGYAQGATESTVNLDNTILIGEGAMIESGGDITLSTAGDNTGNRNTVSTTAQTDLWNKSALPIRSNPTANAEIDHSSLITVETNAYLGGMADTTLTAKVGSHSASGNWSYQDLYQGLAEDIANGIIWLFTGNSDTVSLKETGGSSVDERSSGVQIDGIVEAGLDNQQFLIIEETITAEQDAMISGDPILTFSSVSGEDSLIREDGGSWLDDGFVHGQYITISGSGENDGAYRITGVTDTALSLDERTALDETASDVAGATIQIGIMQGDPTLDFSTDNDTISRSDGSWVEDGFEENQVIIISGAGGNDGFYTITGISVDHKTLYLEAAVELAATDVAGVTVKTAGDTTAELSGPGLSFSGDTIVRSEGSWGDEGFAAGQVIQVSGTTRNDGYYTLGSVSGDTLTLTESLTGEDNVADAEVTARTLGANALTEGQELDFDAASHTITRAVGSWLDDGFETGDEILISGAGANNGTATVTGVTVDTLTLSEDIADDNNVIGAVITVSADGDALTESQELDFVLDAGTSTITRAVGSWLDDGFAEGQIIQVSGSGANDSFYRIESVNETQVTLASETALSTTITGVEGVILQIASDPVADMFTVTFTHDGSGRDTIVLSSGTWADAGFEADQILFVTGAGDNTGFVTIDEVDGSTLYLTVGDVLVDGEVSAGVHFTAGVEQILDISLTLDFQHVDPRDTITRSSGSFLDDGFTAGMTVDVDGTVDNDGSYAIDGISNEGLTLYLDDLYTLDAETVTSGATVTSYQTRSINIHETVMDGSPTLDFAAVSGNYDTIIRSMGSWVADGFREGQTITISGSGSNDGEYRIATLDDDTLYLYMLDTVVDETGAAGVTVSGAGITEGIDMPTLVTEDLALNIASEIDRLQQLKIAHGGDALAIAGYEVELAQLIQQGLELGLISADDPGLDNASIPVSPITEYMVTYIVLPDIEAGSGDITVNASYLSGTGTLIASGDTAIEVVNNSPYYLRVNDMFIPSSQGGTIRFNGLEVTSNDNVNAAYDFLDMDVDTDGIAAFTSIVASGSDGETLISISNTFDPDFAVQAEFGDVTAPDIEVDGTLRNLSGTIRITNNEGSIIVNDDGTSENGEIISAKTIDIDAGRDFVLTTNGYYHTGGNPSGAQDSAQIAGNNIFINARYLNLNGTLQSGRADRSVTLTSDMDALIADFIANYDGSNRYLTLTSDEDGSIEARYDYETGQIIIDSVAIEGGYMMLAGHILNTSGSGTLKVVDGYGNITIDNQTAYAMVLNQIDSGGEGIEGTIKIVDTVDTVNPGGTANGNAPKVTVYTRIGNEIYVEVDGVVQEETTSGRLLEDGYQPKEGQRYVYVTGTDRSTVIAEEYVTESFWGIDWLVADPGRLPDETWTVSVGTAQALDEGYYIDWVGGDNSADVIISDPFDYDSGEKQFIGEYKYTTSHGWWIFSTTKYHTVTYWGQIVREFSHVSVKADYPIDIEFIGSDSGSVSVISDQDIYINGSIINTNGTTTLESDGAIVMSSSGAVVEGTDITLTAATGIGEWDNRVSTDLKGGVLEAVAQSGDVSIEEIDGDLVFSEISTLSGDVVVTADEDILAATASSLISGGSISLTAMHGALGSDARALRLDSGAGDGDRITAWAMDDIYLEETAGDLHVESISSRRGDVEITVTVGDILDFNDNETQDERAIDELSALWADMMLTIDTGATEAMQQNVTAYEGLMTREYQSYWRYRNQQADPSVYDPDFQVSLSDGERAYYSDTLGWDDAAIAALELKRTDEYHSMHETWGALGDSYDADYAYSVEVGSDEYNSLTNGYAWTDSELSNSISADSFRTKTDTETTIEEANITAENIRMYVGGGVGSVAGSFDIDMSNGISGLSDAEKVMLAAAERDDMLFLNAEGEDVDPLDTDATVATLRITLHEDIDVDAGGGVTITANDHIYLGSEVDIQADSIVGGGEVRIKVGGSIVNNTDDGSANISGAGLILEAGDGYIGTAAALLQVEMPEGAVLTARAMDDIFLSSTLGDLAIDTLYSEKGSASLEAEAGSILDGIDNDLWNIQVVGGLYLTASGNIGSADNALDVDLDVMGVYNATAGGDIFLAETSGDMRVGRIVAGGYAGLTAAVSILDAGGEANGLAGNPDADVIANSITLVALLGSLGASGDDLDINSAATAAGMLTASSRRNAYLIETAGDLTLNQVGTGEDSTAFIVSPGRILNGGSGTANVVSGATRLYAGDDIGTEDTPLYTEIDGLEGRSTSGTVWITNAGHLTVGGVSEADGVQAGGGVSITAGSPVTVVETIQAADIVITAGDDDADGTEDTNDDLIVRSGVILSATAGDVVLRAGDDLIIETGASVMAAGNIALYGDYNEVGNADTAGGIVDLQGSVTANALVIYGNSDDDTIVLPGLPSGVPATVWMGDGDDLLYVGSEATPTSNTGGVADSLADLLTVFGGGGTDTLNVDDSGDADGNIGALTHSRITGLGMAEGIVYATVEAIEINLGSGDDTFNVRSTSAGTGTQVNGNDGDDSLIVSSDPENGTLEGIRGDIHFDGGDGSNNMILSDRGNTGGRSDVIVSENGISGLGDGIDSGTVTHENIDDLELLMGSGDDSITVTGAMANGMTRLRMGAGDDRVVMRDESTITDGPVVGFGEEGADHIDASAWNTDLILLGDGGSTTFADSTAPVGSVETENASGDGDDTLIGGRGNDIIFGGMGADTLSGNGGTDILIGDGARVSQHVNGSLTAETTDFFVGGDDRLKGGPGNDLIMGGAAHDTLYGSMSEDILVGDNARVRFDAAGKVLSIIRLGQGALDLIAKTQFDLFSKGVSETRPLPAMTALAPIGHDGVDVTGSHLVSKGIHLDQMRHGGAVNTGLETEDQKDTGKTAMEVAPAQPQTFGEAFSEARKAGKRAGDTFIWNGGVYDAGIPGETPEKSSGKPESEIPDTVPESSETKPGPSAQTNASPKIMTVVAGSLGWQLAQPKKQTDETKIDPKAFGFLEKKMHRRQFREWTGNGFLR